MKARQFKQLASVGRDRRAAMVVEGLEAIGENVARLASEIEACSDAKAFRAAQLAYNVSREEAGKFLALIDAYRVAAPTQETLVRQFGRCGDHLAKLLYAEIADYSIATRNELVSALDRDRVALYLDGPNDYDFIYRNELIAARESLLYVDLISAEGTLEWWTPWDHAMAVGVPGPVRLIAAILGTGLVSVAGLGVLANAWADFDPGVDSHCRDWTVRTRAALSEFPSNIVDGRWSADAWLVADRWPMPMVDLDLSQIDVKESDLVEERERRWQAFLQYEYGDGESW